MIGLVVVPVALAVLAAVHGIRVRRDTLARFEAHSARLRGLPHGRR